MELELKIHEDDLSKFEMLLFGQEYDEYKDVHFKVKTIENNKLYHYSIVTLMNRMPLRYVFSCVSIE